MIRMTPKQRLTQLSQTLAVCFELLKDYDNKEVANYTGLHPKTIWRLRNGYYSLAIHFGTVQALGLAAGLLIEMHPRKGIQLSNSPYRRTRQRA